MNKLVIFLFLFIPFTSHSQFYVSPVAGIDGLHLEMNPNIGWVEESFQIDAPTYGIRSTYVWNRLSLNYLALITKKEYDYIYAGFASIPYPKNRVDIRKQSFVASYHFFSNFRIKTGVYHILLKNTLIRIDGIESETEAVFQDYGIEMGLLYEYHHFFITASYNHGLKSVTYFKGHKVESNVYKPSKSYSLYLGYQFKIFDPKWLNKKGQKCPKF